MVLKFFRKDKIYSPNENIDNYIVLKILGEGRYGICYLVYKDKHEYIIKQLKRDMIKKSGHKIIYEQEILENINHKSIPNFIKKIENNNFLGYVLEFKKGKTFEEIIYKDNYVFSREEIYDIGLQIIDILKYLHNNGIVHRDIRVPNTLYHEGKVQLVDFGLARYINNERYREDVDFSYIGDFLLHLYYTSFEVSDKKEKPWYDELNISNEEKLFLKKLLGIESRYKSIEEVKQDFSKFINEQKNSI